MSNVKLTKGNILIVHTWGLGDFILLTPVLNVIHTLYPDIRFSFLFFPHVAALPIIHSNHDYEITYAGNEPLTPAETLIRIRKRGYAAALITSGVTSWKAWLYLLFVSARRKVGEYRKHRLPFLTDYVSFDANLSRTRSNYRLLASVIDIPPWEAVEKNRRKYNLYTSYALTDEEKSFAEDYWQEHNLTDKYVIGIHPGCMAKNKYRRWAPDSFVSLMQLISASHDVSYLVIAGPDELQEGTYIAQKTGSLLVSHTPLGKVASLISKCSFFINTDSGIGHLASCFQVKSMTIFGPGDEMQTAPFSPVSHVVRQNVSCAPCVGSKKPECNLECLVTLTPEAVYQEVEKYI